MKHGFIKTATVSPELRVADTAYNAEKIIEARDANDIFSIEELRELTGVSKAVIELLRRNHVLDGLSETNQFSFF